MSLDAPARQSLFAVLLACAFVATFLITRQATIAAASISQPALTNLPLTLNDWEGADAANSIPRRRRLSPPISICIATTLERTASSRWMWRTTVSGVWERACTRR